MILKSPAFLLKLKVSIFTTPLNTQRKSGGILLEVSILGEWCSGCWNIHNKWCPWCRLPLAKFNTGTFCQLGCPFWSKIDLAMPITRALSNILQLQELHLLKYFLKMTSIFLFGKISSDFSPNGVHWVLNYAMRMM